MRGACRLSLIYKIVISVKNIMPKLGYLPSFIIYGCFSVAVYTILLLALYRRKILMLINK